MTKPCQECEGSGDRIWEDMQGNERTTLKGCKVCEGSGLDIATKEEIELALTLRMALNEGDSTTTAKQIADILADYRISLQDIQRGLPERRLRA